MPCSAKAAVGRSFHDSGRTVPDLNQETTPKKKNERIGSNLWLLQSSGHPFFCFTAHEQMIGRSIFFRGAICCCVLDSGCRGFSFRDQTGAVPGSRTVFVGEK
jgi:hypothetical protein